MGCCISSPKHIHSHKITPVNKPPPLFINELLPREMRVSLNSMDSIIEQSSTLTNPTIIRHLQTLWYNQGRDIIDKYRSRAVECSDEALMNQVIYFYEKLCKFDYKMEKMWFISEHYHLTELGRDLILQQHLKDVREGHKIYKFLLLEYLETISRCRCRSK